MTREERVRLILGYLKSHQIATLAWEMGGQARAAVVDFSETDKLEIIFTTLTKYRKYDELLRSPKVAFAVGGENGTTVQYEGICRELWKEEFQPYLEYHVEKNPVEAKFAKMDEARFFKVTPTWIRYANYSASPNEIFEITF